MIITIVFFIAIIIAIPLIGAAMMNKESSISREIIVNKPRTVVFDYVKMLKNADHYNKWVMMDPNVRKTYTGEDGTIGFINAWDSDNKNVGQGEQEIIGLKENEEVGYEIRFKKPFQATSYADIKLSDAGDMHTVVKWTFNSTLGYGMRLFYFLFSLKKKLGDDLYESLTNLKNNLEKN